MSEAVVPVLVLGDAPNMPTGLGRIARDLTAALHLESRLLGIEVAQLGLGWDGSPWPWRVYPLKDEEGWGERDLARTWGWHAQGRPGVLFTIWDPSRCFGTLHVEIAAERWGYFAIDSHGPGGKITGPAGEVLNTYDRVLAYGRWGSRVIKASRTIDHNRPVSYLPHGVDLVAFKPAIQAKKAMAFQALADGRPIVGAVVANQRRKDLGLLFETVAAMGAVLWLHIDAQTTEAWSIPQLAEDWGLNSAGRLWVTSNLSDEDLAILYSACAATMHPGLGEGFCYPIVESLACGTPAVHGTYGGGAELIPQLGWRITPVAYRTEGAYNQVRPVYSAQGYRVALTRAIEWKQREPAVVQAYCRGAVAHLEWTHLWGRWRSWFKQGLQDYRRRHRKEEGGRERGGDLDRADRADSGAVVQTVRDH